MEYLVLGPLEVRGQRGPVALAGAKQRALLALLLLHANEVVSRSVLLEELWPDAPREAGHSLDVQISRLRAKVGEALVTRGGGYVLEVEPDELDTSRFERLVDEGRRANADARPADALIALDAALALWRGDALADLADESFARVECERLDELRIAAIEERCEALLALGRDREVVPELEALVARHPLRERARGQLMLAFYRSGRQADALRVYGEGRRLLVDELGLEPAPELRALEQAILRQDPSLAGPARRTARATRRRGAIVAAGTLVAAAAAAGAGLVLARGGTESSKAAQLATPDSIVLLSADTGKIAAATSVRRPALVRYGAGALWSVSDLGELTQIDPATGGVLRAVNAGVTEPCGLAVGTRSVWVTDCHSPTLVRIDAPQGVVVARIPLPRYCCMAGSQPHEIALGANSVWVAQSNFNPSFVDRLDFQGRRQARIRIPDVGASALAYGDGALWVASSYIGALYKIDPRINRVVAKVRHLHGEMCCVAVGGGSVWAATGADHKVWRLTEGGSVQSSFKLRSAVTNLAYADGAVWAADGDAGTAVRIDPTTDATRTYRLGHDVVGVAADGGRVAAGVRSGASDVSAGLRGRVVRVALASNYLDWTSTDPAATQGAFNPWQVAFHDATCARLYRHLDANGAAGRRLVPEVAAGWPTVSDRGRTVVFRIRRGYRFSPPTNEPVTAASFAHEIERFLSPQQDGPWSVRVIPELAGAAAYHAGKAPHVAGVSVRGNELVLRLTRAAPDLPSRLALPQFCAESADLPMVWQGLPHGVPSAGPYYLARRSADVLVLLPNPNYHGPRRRHLDAIVYRMNMNVRAAAAAVERGRLDYLLEDDPALAPTTPLARGAGRRYRRTPNNWTESFALNSSRPLFADARLRRAVAHAIDRVTLAGGQMATTQLLPSAFVRFAPPRYPLRADVRAARLLAGGASRSAVLATADPSAYSGEDAFVEAVRGELGAIGIRVRLLPLEPDDTDAERAAKISRADLTAVQRNAGYAVDPVRYLVSLPYLPAVERSRLSRIGLLSSPKRDRAAAALARLAREAVVLPYAANVLSELVSPRLGCIVHQPAAAGVDLAALCLR